MQKDARILSVHFDDFAECTYLFHHHPVQKENGTNTQ